MSEMYMGRGARLSFIASFCVYTMPIFGPHAVWLVGQVLFQTGQDPVWRLSTWVLVLGVQLLCYVWFRFCFRFKVQRTSLTLMLVSVPFTWLALFVGIMQVIPAWRLVESDPAPEKGGLAEVCKIDGKWILLSGQFERALFSGLRSRLLLQDASRKYWFLSVPGCALTEVPFPKSTPERAYVPVEVARGGQLLYASAIRGQANQDYGFFEDGKLAPLVLFRNLDLARVSQPKLSPDGRAVAWIFRTPGGRDDLMVAPVGQRGMGTGSGFQLRNLGPGVYDIIDVTDGAREILLARNLREYVLVSSEGNLLWQLSSEPGVRPMLGTLRVGVGRQGAALRDYTAWDGYRDGGRYVIQWRRGEKLVQKEIPLGRSISAADASSDGRYVAASISRAVSIGSIDDTVVIWAADGSEVFRKRLPQYSRAPIVFLTGNLVAYSEVDSKSTTVTRVLKLW